jgi:hypothetical protein
MFTWGYIKNFKNKKLWLGIYNGFTSNPFSLGNKNIFLKEGDISNGTKSSYYNTSEFAITKSPDLLKKRPNTSNSDGILESIENNSCIQNKINFDFENKIDVIKNNKLIMDNLSSETSFFIQQHFENCYRKIDCVCNQCILIEQKYGIINVISEFILIK